MADIGGKANKKETTFWSSTNGSSIGMKVANLALELFIHQADIVDSLSVCQCSVGVPCSGLLYGRYSFVLAGLGNGDSGSCGHNEQCRRNLQAGNLTHPRGQHNSMLHASKNVKMSKICWGYLGTQKDGTCN